MVTCYTVQGSVLSLESVLFLVPYINDMWAITHMQVMLSSIGYLISLCGAVDSSGEIIVMCSICCVLCRAITSSCYWILRLFLFYASVSSVDGHNIVTYNRMHTIKKESYLPTYHHMY
jgi:hypothetical protein